MKSATAERQKMLRGCTATMWWQPRFHTAVRNTQSAPSRLSRTSSGAEAAQSLRRVLQPSHGARGRQRGGCLAQGTDPSQRRAGREQAVGAPSPGASSRRDCCCAASQAGTGTDKGSSPMVSEPFPSGLGATTSPAAPDGSAGY